MATFPSFKVESRGWVYDCSPDKIEGGYCRWYHITCWSQSGTRTSYLFCLDDAPKGMGLQEGITRLIQTDRIQALWQFVSA